MSDIIIGQEKKELKDLENGTLLDDDFQAFRLASGLEVIAKKDENGDYPMMMLRWTDAEGVEHDLKASRDEMAAITFALAREDQKSKLLTAQFRKYKEVPVRLVIRALKDIKKDELVITYRKERVPIDFDYDYRA